MNIIHRMHTVKQMYKLSSQDLFDEFMSSLQKSQLQSILSDMNSTCNNVDAVTDYNNVVDELQKVETFCDALADGRLTNTDDALDDINEKLEENCVDYLEFLDDNELSKPDEVSLSACCYFIHWNILLGTHTYAVIGELVTCP